MTASPSLTRTSGASAAHRPSMWARTRAVWVSRRILGLLIVRDLKVRYSDSALGYLWTLLDPLLMAGVYWIVFGYIIDRGSDFEKPYLLWLLLSILAFNWTRSVMNDSSRILGQDAKLVMSSSLPREIWLLRSVGSRFMEFLFTVPITVGATLIYGQRVEWDVFWWLPVALLVHTMFNIGLALALAPLTMLYPDMERVVRVFTTMYRYLSPVLYGLYVLQLQVEEKGWPSWYFDLYILNPLAGILNAYQAILFPRGAVDPAGPLAVAAAVSFVLFWTGWWIFRRTESRVLKEL